MALFLISERAAGSASPWAAYLQTLPGAPPSPLFWGAHERDLLAGTQLLQSLEAYECALSTQIDYARNRELIAAHSPDRAMECRLSARREYFEETFAQLAAGLFSQQPGLFPAGTFTAAAFQWAAVTVRSRSRPPLEGEDLALVPFADLV